MARDSCMSRVVAGVAVGGAVGGAVGAVYGTYESIRYKLSLIPTRLLIPSLALLAEIMLAFMFWASTTTLYIPGLLKIRHIGQTTVGSAAIFGLFLGCGSLIHCGKSY